MKKIKGLQEGTNVVGKVIDSSVQKKYNSKKNPNRQRYKLDKKVNNDFTGEDDYDEDYGDDGFDDFDDKVAIQPGQKSESFHHFILENQYKDLERSIRGFKDIFNKEI